MSVESTECNTRTEDSLASAASSGGEGRGHCRCMAGGWPVGVFFALLGAGAAWGLFQAYHPVFRVPPELASIEMPNSRQAAEINAAEIKAGLLNALLVLGWMGALLAGAMTAGQAWARRSWRIALFGVVGCGLVGALFGALAGWAGHVVYYSLLIPFEGATNLQRTVVVQAVMLGVLGGGVGGVLGTLSGFGRDTCARLLGGALAGVFAGMVFPFVAGYFFPKTHIGYVVPRDATGAFLWLATTAVCLGLIVPGLTLRRTCDASGEDEALLCNESPATG